MGQIHDITQRDVFGVARGNVSGDRRPDEDLVLTSFKKNYFRHL